MKLLLTTAFLATFFLSCSKCTGDKPSACSPGVNDLPNELCEALWTSWLYNADNNTCEKKTYGGCNKYGFDTKEECEACKCSD